MEVRLPRSQMEAFFGLMWKNNQRYEFLENDEVQYSTDANKKYKKFHNSSQSNTDHHCSYSTPGENVRQQHVLLIAL